MLELIRKAYGFRGFEGAAVSAEFRGFLDGRAWIHAEGPGALFEHGVGWLRRNRVLLPGITVLVRLVATVREAAAERMHTALAAAAAEVDPALPGRLRASLRVPAGSRFSEMESWRRAPTRVSGPGLVQALERAAALAGLGVRAADCSACTSSSSSGRSMWGSIAAVSARSSTRLAGTSRASRPTPPTTPSWWPPRRGVEEPGPGQCLHLGVGADDRAAAADGGRAAGTRARMIPELFWPDWSARLLASDGYSPDRLRALLSVALLIPGHPEGAFPTHAAQLNPDIRSRDVAELLQRLTSATTIHPDPVLTVLCRIAEYLDRQGSPIDYQRRRDPHPTHHHLEPLARARLRPRRAPGRPARPRAATPRPALPLPAADRSRPDRRFPPAELPALE